LLAGWPRDVNRLGTQTYQRYLAKYPRLASVQQTSSSAGTFSVELTLAARPEVAIFTFGMGPSQQELAQLERAGIPVVFLDFVSQPFENLERSLTILGEVTGSKAKAEAFIELRRERMALISERLRTGSPGMPNVFLEA